MFDPTNTKWNPFMQAQYYGFETCKVMLDQRGILEQGMYEIDRPWFTFQKNYSGSNALEKGWEGCAGDFPRERSQKTLHSGERGPGEMGSLSHSGYNQYAGWSSQNVKMITGLKRVFLLMEVTCQARGLVGVWRKSIFKWVVCHKISLPDAKENLLTVDSKL